MSVTAAPTVDHSHDEHHDHPEWLAHHFDDAEQQYDSGKLGMWLFLVTEVLFFSGMFCGYAYLRSRDPETFAFASQFLNEQLGAINTGILLFSSLTMAWAVRASQLSQHKLLLGLLAATLSCASMFLGVKTVEYSHKWDLGRFPGKFYVPQGMDYHGETNYLLWLCAIPILFLVAFGLYYIVSAVKRNSLHTEIAGPLFVSAVMFFGGVGLGTYLESGDHSGGHHAAADGEHAGEGEHAAGGEHADDEHAADEHSDGVEHAAGSYAEREYAVESNDMFKMAEADRLTDDGPTSTAANIQENQDEQYGYTPSQSHEGEVATATDDEVPMAKVNQPGKAGLFFSIYYCMTGVHAVHILAGMLVISWLIVKAARREFHSKYYGPVDNVGLYWHLVDFIWIYLFPLMYLIG